MYPGYPQYPQQMRKPIDYAKMVFIGAWVVLGLYGLNFFYLILQDEESPLGFEDFADRFFGHLPQLAEGLFFTGILLAVSMWIGHQQRQQQQQQPPQQSYGG